MTTDRVRIRRSALAACLTGLLTLASQSAAEPHIPLQSSALLDRDTARVLALIEQGDLAGAEPLAASLAARFPRFALGQLLHAELQAAQAGMALHTNPANAYSPRLIGLLLEARTRLEQHDADPGVRHVPTALIQSSVDVDHVIVADLALSRLYLFDTRGQHPRLLRAHYGSSGRAGFGKLVEGDLKTPLGVYRIRGFRSDRSLPDLYGSGALILDYPNPLDRHLGRTGSGIWLHGVPHENLSRAPRSSEGCVTMANDYLLSLRQQIDLPRTRVVLSDRLEWVPADTLDTARERVAELFELYRTAWIRQDIDDLLALYHEDALPPELASLNPDSPRARRVVQRERPSRPFDDWSATRNLPSLADIPADRVSVFAYPDLPGSPARIVMEFSLHEGAEAHITLHWRQSADGQWSIEYEHIDNLGA